MPEVANPDERPTLFEPAAAPRPNRMCGVPILRRLLRSLSASIGSWRSHVLRRRWLAHLDDRTLRDLGLERSAVETESTTSFWRLW